MPTNIPPRVIVRHEGTLSDSLIYYSGQRVVDRVDHDALLLEMLRYIKENKPEIWKNV